MFQLPFPVHDANASSGSGDLGKLPEWDLSDLYAGEDAPELSRDLDWLQKECAGFAADYEGKLADLDADALEKELHASVFEHLADHLKRLALVLQRLALHARLSIVEVLGYGILNA